MPLSLFPFLLEKFEGFLSYILDGDGLIFQDVD